MSQLDKILERVVATLDDKKAGSIAIFDVEGVSALTDRVVIVSANNEIHCKALLETLSALSKEPDFKSSDEVFKPSKVSGAPESGWVVVDMNSVLVHILTAEMRGHYELDGIYEKRANAVEHV